ncbi:protein IMPACT-A-like [Diadema setosum]|uniref:protein IMPACT-A-like n=1 Tax=Diadema setosum TaxID=31175 RepID=UPI003B3B4293
MEEDNLTRQVDEIEAMSAIYGDDWCVVDEVSRIYCIAVSDEARAHKICLQVILPDDYPSTESPIYQLNAPWLKNDNRVLLETSLADVCKENLGESALYLLVERIREFLTETVPPAEIRSEAPEKEPMPVESFSPSVSHLVREEEDVSPSQVCHIELPPIMHGEPITDKRSTFQAHLAFPVVEVKQVKYLLQKLCENKKIANATHNIMAYRIYKEDRDSFIQDCDDDGETAAGGRLMHLLQIVDARNVMVVVSRWYGGILLGPDRFKHINNAARNILDSSGFIQAKESNQKAKKTKQKHR